MRGAILLILFPTSLFSGTLTRNEADAFVRALLWQKASLHSWFDAGNLAASHRLGIEYEGVGNKNLIAYDIDDSLKLMVRDRRLGYSVAVDTLHDAYARLVLTIGKADITRMFYFKGAKCISPLAYITRDWTRVESKHFRIFLSDSTLFNIYCVGRLESFLTRVAALLGLRDRDMQTLQKEKIYYYLCKDEDEIQRLTGFRARGMCNLAYDAVITTYNNHEHELMHLLVNYRLRRLPLYTHPMLQEGIAVAYGGRGGMESGVLLPLGGFLCRSHSVEVSSLRDKEEFAQIDPSMSYPAAGLYTKFLVESLGMASYLELYRTHCGSAGDRAVLHIDAGELPDSSRWARYMDRAAAHDAITFDTATGIARIVYDDGSCRISEDSARYYFSLSGVLALPGRVTFPAYVSKAFRDVLPGRTYGGEEFLFRATDEEISVYNLFTNNLIASYAVAFSIPPARVPRRGEKYFFAVNRGVFDEPFPP